MILPGVKDPVAYFCSEFAIDNELPIYSGGLGVLAGDLMNEAAFQHFPLIGVGILYKGKQFLQHVTGEGHEEKRDSEFDHDTSFLRPTTEKGEPIIITLPVNSQEVKVKSYHLRLSDNTILFLLSTNVDGNPPEWIADMDALYHGDTDSQIRQQIILGVGGVMLLEKLEIKPRMYHINEGRPAFAVWEVCRLIMEEENIDFTQAWVKAKQKIVYTNHTLVSAGNPTYPKDTIAKWSAPFAQRLGVTTDEIIKEGLQENMFNLTLFALNSSGKQNAVSRSHARFSKKEWPNYDWIAVTNGINKNRWQDSDFRNPSIKDADIWNLHLTKKQELVETVIKRTGFGYDPGKLVVSWARRLAEYKQPKIIFKDIQRLKNILQNEKYPVQLLFAGNSHSADPNSKSIIEEIISLFASELRGSAIFIPNYNISLANHLTSGSDVWLNTPKGNFEACGTSGMKALSNGVLNLTVLDGWTHEVEWDGIGWTLEADNVAESFYEKIEKEIIPLFYQKDESGVPRAWVDRMKASIAVSKNFSTERMLEEYKKKLYN
jgi:glycogen phosphorylase